MKIKKLLLTTFVMVMAMSIHALGTSFAESNIIAKPIVSEVIVNGTSIEFEAYTIDDNNYFKLRDIAKVISGTEKQFAVGWDSLKNAISLTSGDDYKSVGGELAKANKFDKIAILNNSEVFKDGKSLSNIIVYTINGNNFFKLRDLSNAFNIGIGYDVKTKRITVDTTVDYVDPAKVAEEVVVVKEVAVAEEVIVVEEVVVVEELPLVDDTSNRIEGEDESNSILRLRIKKSIKDTEHSIVKANKYDGGGDAAKLIGKDSLILENCPSAASLTFKYKNLNDVKNVNLYVDDKKIDTLFFPDTKDNNYREINFNTNIPEGANVKIELTTFNSIQIDYIDFNKLPRDIVVEEIQEVEEYTPKLTRREAEDMTRVSHSGNMWVEGTSIAYFEDDGEYITFKDCPVATSLSFRYACPKSTSSICLYVNNKKIKALSFRTTGGYYTYSDYKVKVNIPKGADVKLKIEGYCGTGINLDYIDFINE